MTRKRFQKLLRAIATKHYIADKANTFGNKGIGKVYKEISSIGFKNSSSLGYSYKEAYILFKNFF